MNLDIPSAAVVMRCASRTLRDAIASKIYD